MCQVCDNEIKFDRPLARPLSLGMATPEPEAVSESLKRAISESGLTPYEIAKRAGTSPQTVTRFLRAERGLSLVVIDRICLALGLELRRPVEPKDNLPSK